MSLSPRVIPAQAGIQIRRHLISRFPHSQAVTFYFPIPRRGRIAERPTPPLLCALRASVVNALNERQKIRKLPSSFWPPTLLTSIPRYCTNVPIRADRRSSASPAHAAHQPKTSAGCTNYSKPWWRVLNSWSLPAEPLTSEACMKSKIHLLMEHPLARLPMFSRVSRSPANPISATSGIKNRLARRRQNPPSALLSPSERITLPPRSTIPRIPINLVTMSQSSARPLHTPLPPRVPSPSTLFPSSFTIVE